MKLIGYSHRCHSCISILLVASIIQTHVFAAVNDTNYSDEQLDETQKDELDRIGKSFTYLKYTICLKSKGTI